MTNLDSELPRFATTLAETIAWCIRNTSLGDPANSLRTPFLRPANLSTVTDQWGNFDYQWGTVDEKKAVVADIALRRAQLLREENAYPDASALSQLNRFNGADGRLLIASPEESDVCGLSEPESLGFIDGLDVPAWDTWVCYMDEPVTPDPQTVRKTQQAYRALYNRVKRPDFADWQPPRRVSYILCWIPLPFVPLVEEGIQVNPVQCFFWAVDYKRNHCSTPLLRQLEAIGLLQ